MITSTRELFMVMVYRWLQLRRHQVKFRSFIFLLLCAAALAAAPRPQSDAGNGIVRGVLVREAQIYLSPDSSSSKLAVADRGREVAILEKSSGEWLHVLATLREGGEQGDKSVSGWILNKGVVRDSTPNGDRILFGEAADSEYEASRRGGRKGADHDAERLYYRTFEYFPNSPLAGEALFRTADIKWQIDRADIFRLPSSKTGNPGDRIYGIDDSLMKQVTKKFPHTRWADLAEFDKLDNKLCGDWQGESKCPQKEADAYEKYAQEHPDSPKLQEALYQAARRRAALIEIYMTENSKSKSDESRQKALELTRRIISSSPVSDWVYRAQDLSYKIEQHIAVLGTSVE